MQCYPDDGPREFRRILAVCILFLGWNANVSAQIVNFEALPGGKPTKLNLLEVPVDSAATLNHGAMVLLLDTSRLNLDSAPEMNVTLLQPNGLKRTVRARPGQIITIPGVTEGYASVVVTSAMMPNSLANPYAAMGFVTRVSQSAVPSSAIVRVPVAMLDVRRLSDDLVQFGSQSGSEAEVLSGTHFAPVGRSQFSFQRSTGGSLTGRVISPQRGFVEYPGATKVMLYRDQVVVAQTTSLADGSFRIDRAPLGDLSLLAVGAGGHAAYRVRITDSGIRQAMKPAVRSATEGFPKLVSVDRRGRMVGTNLQTSDMQILLVPASLNDEVQQLIQQSDEQEQPEELAAPVESIPPPGGGFGAGSGVGGGSGGGGGLGSLGGLAGLAGVAGIAVGAAALADDDDGFNVNQATQITP